MANEEVSNIGVKLSLDASNFTAGLGTAQGKLNTFQRQAKQAASGAAASKAAATPTTLKVEIAPAQLQAALTTAAKGLQTVHVPIDVDSRAIAAMRTKITQGLGVIPVQLAASFPKSGPGSAQAIIGTVFSSMTGVSTAKGQTLAKSAIEQILPKRATGGPVGARQAVVVGEHRAEVFRPGASGFIEKDLQRYRQQAAQLAALEYEISRRQKNVQHALRGARVPMLPPGTSMPPAFGTAPLREGYVRGYHRTGGGDYGEMASNLGSIRRQGLRLSRAQGHLYGEPDANWFTNTPYEEAYAVEAHLPVRWFGSGRRRSDPSTIGGPSSNMAVSRDISRRRFASYSEPWMRHTRYMQERADEESPGRVMRQIGSTVVSMRGDSGYESMTQGYDQFVANAWRARHGFHRASGGYASGGKAMRPVACPTCGLVNWQTMAGPARKACIKCGAPLKMRRMGGMVAHRAYGGEASSLYGGDPEALEAAAIEHFGVTDDIREAGYLTPTGKFLDFSGRHQSEGYIRQGDRWVPKPATGTRDPLYGHLAGTDYLAHQRAVDHYEASEILPGLSGADASDRMKSLGFIRVWGTSSKPSASDARNIGLLGGYPVGTVGAEMSRLPTTAQITRLVGAAREAEHVSVDAMDPMGYRLPGASFRTEWPDDPVGGKRMGPFIRQAIEAIEKNDAKAEEIREAMQLGAGFNPNLHRAGGGDVFAKHAAELVEWKANLLKHARTISPELAQSAKDWYPIARAQAMGDLADFGKPGTMENIAAFAAASPGQPWPSNRAILREILATGAAPHQTIRTNVPGFGSTQAVAPYGYGNWAKAAEIIRSGSMAGLSGPKVTPFFGNLSGSNPEAWTLDARQMRIASANKLTSAPGGGSWQRAILERAHEDVYPELQQMWGTQHRSQAQAILWAGYGRGEDLGSDFARTAKGITIPRHPGLVVPRASGGPVELAALWAKDPYLAIMAYEAQMKQKDQHRARGGRIARDFAGPPLAEVPGRMPAFYKGDQDWLDMMSGQYGWGATGPYQRYVTDEQWRGPEAGQARVAIPGMQNDPELRAILQSMALAKHQKPRMSATGGRAGGGLYIVNEQGDNSEGFVASQDEHLIPKFVMDRIPGARDGARTGMIRKPANSMFAPAQDGMIIPKWAVPYVPALHRAGGGPAGLPPGYTVYQQASSAPGAPPIDYAIPPGITNPLQHILSGAAKTIEEAQAEHAKFVAGLGLLGRASRPSPEITRPSVAQDLAEGRAGIGKELPSRTARGAVASIASYLVGGVQEYDQAMVRRAQAEKSYTSAHRATSTLIKRSADELAGWRVAKEQDLVTDEDRTAIIAKNKPLIQAALATEKARGAELQKATKATLPTTGGILKNLGVIISATSAYGLAMQAANAVLQPAIEGTIKSTQSWVDQFTGFATTSQQVTKAIGDSARNLGGNVPAAVAQAAGQGGLGNAGYALAQQYLTGGALAKGGGAAASQGEDLRKAIMGAIAGAPQGLFGGYGGFLGGGFLGETLGGGKGAVESLTAPLAAAADAAKAASQGEIVGKGQRLAPTAAQTQQSAAYTGLIGSTVSDYNDASKRYTSTLGKADDGLTLITNATPDQIKTMKDHADAERHLGGAYADYADRVADLAKSSTVLLDASGQVVTSMQQASGFWQDVAGGSMIPTLQEYAQQQARGLQANFQEQAAQAQHALSVGIPGQLGTQLAAQPFLPAGAGVLPSTGGFRGTIGGINVADTIKQAQAIQDQLTAQAAAGRTAQEQFVGSQPGLQGPYTSDGQTFASGQAALHSFNADIIAAGAAITMWQTKIANAQTQEQWAQFSNNLRLANRSYADALALAGRGGGGTGSAGELGGLERQQTLLGFMLSQKQINFQTALAGFQAPGLTSEERAAREAQAQAEAKVAQQQLNIQKREFAVSAGRGVTDTGAALKLLKSEQATQTAVAAAQKAIAAEQMKLSQAEAKAQVIQQNAEGNFSNTLASAAGYAAQFGTAVDTAVKQIYASLGYTRNRNGTYSPPDNFSGVSGKPTAGNAAGFLGSYARGAVLQVGEAGPETVAILRNPRAMMMGGGFGGSAPVTVYLHVTVQGDVAGDETIAKMVRAVEDSFNRKAARLGMRTFVSAQG